MMQFQNELAEMVLLAVEKMKQFDEFSVCKIRQGWFGTKDEERDYYITEKRYVDLDLLVEMIRNYNHIQEIQKKPDGYTYLGDEVFYD